MTTAARSRTLTPGDAIINLLAAEGLAIAIWLIPASIHIVKWPVSGPVRLALLAPAWQLAAWSAGAVVVAIAATWSAAKTRVFSPFVMLWLWAIPYLPWIPDRFPLLLVLAGPLRWVIAGAALLSIALNTTKLGHWLSGLLRVGRGTVFVVSLAVYLGLGLYSASETGVGGDEPHYLIITESLLRDHDLKIENNHQRRDYLAFYPGELRPDFFERGKNGEIYSIHAPGLPILILPVYAVAGRLGVVALMAFLAAFTALAMFDLAAAIAGHQPAVLTWLAAAFTVPFIPHAWMIFPELPGALLVAWAARWIWDESRASGLRPQASGPASAEARSVEPRATFVGVWVWRGAALSLLPWLHTKFIVLLAIFGAALAWQLLRRPRALAAFVLPIAIVSASWLYSFYAIYGSFDPEAPYGDYSRIYVLTRNIPHGLLGLFFDQKFGLLFYSPIYLLAVAGAWLVLRREDTRFLGIALIATIAAFVGSTARLYMFWGGSSAPARFLVPVLPCLAPLVALAFAEARHGLARAVEGLWLAISVAIAVAAVIQPARFMLFSDAHGGGARVVEAIQGSAPLADSIPGFTNPDWLGHIGQLAVWLLVAALALATAVAMSRLLRLTSSWRLAGVTALAFFVIGATLAPGPGLEAKQSTARRGDLDVLWRFDGNKYRTLDYDTLSRTTPDRLKALTTIEMELQPDQIRTDTGLTAGPLTLPPGAFETRVWFSGAAAREGAVTVAALPKATFAQVAGSLSSPTSLAFVLPVAIRRLTVRVQDRHAAEAVNKLEIVPVAVQPALAREDIPVRSIESFGGRAGAFMIYADEHAYPEGDVFWSRGTAETTVWVAPAGASQMTLKLATGPQSGNVTVSVAGSARTIAMVAQQIKDVTFDLPAGRQVVPLKVQSSVMFRPSENNPQSTDMRGLGCQVRIGLE